MIRGILFAVAIVLGSATLAMAQLSVVTFVHCSPEPSLRVVDLYVTQAGTTTKIDDIAFQRASNMNEAAIFGDLELTLSVAPSSSINVSEAVYQTTFTPGADKGYMAIFTGLNKPADYVANPNGKAIGYAITAYEVPNSNSDPTKTAVYFFNGSTDLEAGDIFSRGVSKALASSVGFLDRSTTPAILDRKATTIDFAKVGDAKKVLASFSVDLGSMGSNILVSVISGFKTPGDNAKSLDTLCLLNVLEDGRVLRSPLISGSQTSRVQIVHAAADPAFAVVDLYVNGTKAFDNVSFRRASAFVDVPANTPLVIGIAPGTSNAYKDTLTTVTLTPLRPTRAYSIVALGISDTLKFAKNPEGADPRFKLMVYENALEKNGTTKTGVRTLHAVTDAPRVSFASSAVSYASKIGYGDISASYVETEPATDTVWMSDAEGKKLKGYLCDFRGAARATIMIATGFLDPTKNSNGPGLSVILVDASGNVNANVLAIDPDVTSVKEEALIASGWRVSPNPASDVVRFVVASAAQATSVSYDVVDVTGRVLLSGILTAQNAGFEAPISISTLSQGSYRIVARTDAGMVLGSMGLTVSR
ncbi:MAG: DUF4397 domain-containing protein [Candidatus Kapaibacterium sp.]